MAGWLLEPKQPWFSVVEDEGVDDQVGIEMVGVSLPDPSGVGCVVTADTEVLDLDGTTEPGTRSPAHALDKCVRIVHSLTKCHRVAEKHNSQHAVGFLADGLDAPITCLHQRKFPATKAQ